MHRPTKLAFASALLTAPALAQLPTTTVEWVPPFDNGEPGRFTAISSIDADHDGGWISRANYGLDGQNDQLVGVIPSAGITEPTMIRTPGTFGGLVQNFLITPRVLGSTVGYISFVDGYPSAWIGDDVVARRSEPVGASGDVWDLIVLLRLGANGDALVLGTTSSGDVVWNASRDVPVIREGDPIDLVGRPVSRIHRFETSPNGEHWAAIVDFVDPGADVNPAQTILVDGSVLLDGSGSPIRSGNVPSFSTSPQLTGPLGNIRELRINDAGDCVFAADRGPGLDAVVVRNDRVVEAMGPRVLNAIDQRGYALMSASVSDPSFALEDVSLGRSSLPQVDFDGDGAVDLEWTLIGSQGTSGAQGTSSAAFLPDGSLLGVVELRRSDGATTPVVARLALGRPVEVVCDGADNSGGRPAHLRATGYDDAAYNDLTLQVADLPLFSVFLPILSLTPSAPTAVPGSQGSICLGGSIGRLGPAPMSNGFIGPVNFRVFTNLMPQPDGPVSVQPGDTWYAQLWYRDSVGQTATSNFSDAIAIRFR